MLKKLLHLRNQNKEKSQYSEKETEELAEKIIQEFLEKKCVELSVFFSFAMQIGLSIGKDLESSSRDMYANDADKKPYLSIARTLANHCLSCGMTSVEEIVTLLEQSKIFQVSQTIKERLFSLIPEIKENEEMSFDRMLNDFLEKVGDLEGLENISHYLITIRNQIVEVFFDEKPLEKIEWEGGVQKIIEKVEL